MCHTWSNRYRLGRWSDCIAFHPSQPLAGTLSSSTGGATGDSGFGGGGGGGGGRGGFTSIIGQRRRTIECIDTSGAPAERRSVHHLINCFVAQLGDDLYWLHGMSLLLIHLRVYFTTICQRYLTWHHWKLYKLLISKCLTVSSGRKWLWACKSAIYSASSLGTQFPPKFLAL